MVQGERREKYMQAYRYRQKLAEVVQMAEGKRVFRFVQPHFPLGLAEVFIN